VTATVLVVEDDEMIADVVRLSLQPEGFKVSHVTNVDAALATIQKSPPDLILLDITLPEAGTAGVIEDVRSRPHMADVPVIVMAARAMPADQVRIYNVDAAGFLPKPFYPRELVETVRTVMDAVPQH
jgi:DNA-binding response OmpR family regulator